MNIRNFSIIAHIDHGKSTLADRIIELCGGLSEREMTAQVLDTLELEQERGITIKSQTVNLTYKADDGEVYQFNLIDTPGHVDFAYEVSRSLSACEGAILLVDASQGVEAQTLSTCYNAVEEGLTIIPVLNKIDLAQSDPERIKKEIEEIIGVDASNSPSIKSFFSSYLFLLDLNLLKINLLVIGKIIKKPKTSVANPGIIKSNAAKAIAAPEIIS